MAYCRNRCSIDPTSVRDGTVGNRLPTDQDSEGDVATTSNGEPATYVRRETIGLALGPLSFAVVYATVPLPAPAVVNATFACTLWIVVWWITEAVPIPVTSLLPVVLFPLTGVLSVEGATTPYADPIIFLLLGGFLIALAVERSQLHRRIALTVVSFVGFSPGRLVFGFMLATAVLSMWVSNTATAIMMVPIGFAVLSQFSVFVNGSPDGNRGDSIETTVDESTDLELADVGTSTESTHNRTSNRDPDLDAESLPETRLGVALMLGIAYGASIGGAATLIGSPPNAVFAGVVASRLDVEIGFLDWMLFALPGSALFLVVSWIVLMVVLRPQRTVQSAGSDADLDVVDGATGPDGARLLREEHELLGPMTRTERRVLAVFAIVAGGWILRPYVLQPLVPAITDPVIAIAGGILLFVVPVDLARREFLLEWDAVAQLPWGVLILLGAGFSLANAFQESGLDAWIAERLAGLAGLPMFGVLLLIAFVVVFLTEVNSNTATATVFMPIMIGLGLTLGIQPITLMAVAALAASYAFMLPVATPPNAIVFGSGYLTIPQMAQVGIWLNLIGVVLVALLGYLWLPVVFG